MRPIAYMGALKIFGSPCMATPTANFPDISNGLLFRSMMMMMMDELLSCHKVDTVTVRTKFEIRSNVRRALKQRQNTGIADIIDIADNVNLKYRYTVLWIKTDIQITHHYEATPPKPGFSIAGVWASKRPNISAQTPRF